MSEEKSDLEKKVLEGIYGPPQIKKREKNHYLGEFEERVIRYLTYKQVLEPGTYPQILEAIKHPQAQKLIIDREVDLEYAQDYINLALEHNLSFKRIDSPEFRGDVALVVTSDKAVNVNIRKVEERRERLQKLGISDTIIENPGAKLCRECWQELQEKAPEELVNYRKLRWIDKMLGEKCINSQ